MNNIENPSRRSASAKSNGLAVLCVALALAGCGKPVAKSPEKSLVRTAVVQPMDNIRSDGEASYIAIVHFDRETPEWQARLEGLDGVTSVQAESEGFYRVLTSSGSKTTMQLVELAASLGETLTSLSVQNTTLDDVFVHYTGRQLRDEQVKPPVFTLPPRPGAQP